MKFVDLTETEIEVLKEMCHMAVWNANHITQQSYAPETTAQYKALCTLYNKITS